MQPPGQVGLCSKHWSSLDLLSNSVQPCQIYPVLQLSLILLYHLNDCPSTRYINWSQDILQSAGGRQLKWTVCLTDYWLVSQFLFPRNVYRTPELHEQLETLSGVCPPLPPANLSFILAVNFQLNKFSQRP